MANTNGFAYLAASMLTRSRVAAVAADYLTWVNSKPTLATAENALLAAATSSKSPAQVLANAETYYAAMENDPPTITGNLSPATGTTAGGTVVTINGTNLAGTTGVTFGGTAGTSIVNVSDTQVRVTTPAKTAGAVTVVLTTPAGSATKTTAFTFA
jgi:hypothetical protein